MHGGGEAAEGRARAGPRGARSAGAFDGLILQDNQGNRDALLHILMTSGPAEDVDAFLGQFPDEVLAHLTYLAALHRFRRGPRGPRLRAASER